LVVEAAELRLRHPTLSLRELAARAAPPATKAATGSNHAFLFAARTGPARAVVTCAIDNLGKGAAGQAIQNMNVALGLPEMAGLGALGIFP